MEDNLTTFLLKGKTLVLPGIDVRFVDLVSVSYQISNLPFFTLVKYGDMVRGRNYNSILSNNNQDRKTMIIIEAKSSQNPAFTISFIRIYPLEKTIALGGVDIGNI
jgi:hypothetical protein